MDKQLNFGLDLSLNEEHSKRETNYKLGAVSDKIVLQEDGQWTEFMPECEIQKTDYDDLMDCVSESSINVQKILMKQLFNFDINFSQRFRAKMSGTTRSGNSLYNVANSARKDGFVEEEVWPRDRSMTWDVYYKPIPLSIKTRGQKTTLEFEVNYESVPTNKESLKQALKYGPVQVIGYAWASENGIYKDYGYRPNHAFTLVGYVEGQYWIIYDSYPTDFIIDNDKDKQEYTKKLDWDFNFGDAMLYSIKLKTTDKESWLYKLINMIREIWVWFETKGSPKGLRAYYVPYDSNGNPRGKQNIDFMNPILAVKCLYMALFNAGMLRKTNWPEISKLKDENYI